MKTLVLDPSSTCTGYAICETGPGKEVTFPEAGTIKGKKTDTAVNRVLAMRADLLQILNEFKPDVVLVEMPLDKQYTRHAARESGLAVWAGAAWALWMVCIQWSALARVTGWGRVDVHSVSNTLWTRRWPKEHRVDVAKVWFKGYDPAKDKGANIADAICLARWWLSNEDDAR